VRSSTASARRAGRPPRPLRALLALAALAALLPAAGARAAGERPDLDALLAHFARSRGVEASFREEKTLPLLAEPLVSEGVLYYAPPGRMARFTTSPERTSLLLVGDRLRLEDSLGVDEIDLAERSEARRFVEQLLVLFRGDADALRRDYEASFEWRDGPWTLALVPRDRRVREIVREIALRGDGPRLDEMVVTGTEGEVTRTTYARVVTDRPFRDEEIARLFPEEGAPRPLRSPPATSP